MCDAASLCHWCDRSESGEPITAFCGDHGTCWYGRVGAPSPYDGMYFYSYDRNTRFHVYQIAHLDAISYENFDRTGKLPGCGVPLLCSCRALIRRGYDAM